MLISKKYINVYKRMLSTAGCRYILLTGGRGSGKTHIIRTAFKDRVLRISGEVGLITKYTYTGTIKMIPDLRNEFYDTDATVTNNKLTCNGNFYYIDGIRSNYISKLKSINKLSFWVCDEAQDIQKLHEFQNVDASIRGGIDSLTVLILNPTSKLHWIYKHFFNNVDYQEIKVNNHKFFIPIIKDTDVLHVHTSFLDIKEHLDAAFINNAKKMLESDPRQFAKVYLGLFEENTDEKVFNYLVNFEDFDRSLPCLIGVDFGFNPDPTAFVKVWVDKDNKRIFAEVLHYERRMSIDEIVSVFNKYNNDTFICDTNMKNLTEQLKQSGLNIYYKNQRVSLKEQVEKVREYTILTSSQVLVNELTGYCYDDKKTFIAAEGDHAIDAMRYAAFELI